ncbi:Pex19 protein [Suhomyces tanzawaensis NRRL Y-17324]|uniref:Pex19 protein n=1 Tax=Suhomyces tanzawaensis NRRL Y-17324 TaxID=984487 RepID=A0A1E4SLA9_9ASCO|nr:Pex19 protein [Suhomyces tanzawaensis NRRL Y-17324]ODV80284.1 Pex19 protein [Suhomyces tanzawaensis NRRL Y-17324]
MDLPHNSLQYKFPIKSNAPAANTSAGGDDVDDLDDLLDDFADDILDKPPGSTIDNNTTADEPLNDEFKANIGDLIKDLNIEDPETKDQVENLIKQFELNHREEAETEAKKPYNFEYVMKETMERLKKSGEDIDEKIKNDPAGGNPEDMLTQLLAGLGGPNGGLGDGDMDMSKLLVDMLEQLSSKDVLYEPIKDLNTKFPDYLKEKQGTITEHQYKNYNAQFEITNDILAIFDAPDYSDDNKAQRDRVNSLLESLQELGQPPTELIGDNGDFPGFGGLGGLGGDGKDGGLDFNDKDLPKDLEKELEEGCKQQ